MPASREAEAVVRAALASAPGTASLATAALTPVPGGLSNFAWRADARDGDVCFVRLARDRGERLGADHVNECRVLAVTSRAGLSPPVIRCDAARRLLVTRWVQAPEAGRDVRRGADVDAVARSLAALHALTVPAGLRRVDFEVQARQLGAALDAGPSRALHVTADRVFRALRDDAPPPVLCHNDLNALNLLLDRDGRPWLVDWEYAGLGDRAIDLASFASQHGLDARLRGRLLEAYSAAGGSIDPGRWERARWAFDYVQWLWYRAASMQPGTPLPADLAQARIVRLAASLQGRASRLLRCNNAPFGG